MSPKPGQGLCSSSPIFNYNRKEYGSYPAGVLEDCIHLLTGQYRPTAAGGQRETMLNRHGRTRNLGNYFRKFVISSPEVSATIRKYTKPSCIHPQRRQRRIYSKSITSICLRTHKKFENCLMVHTQEIIWKYSYFIEVILHLPMT